MGSRDHRGRPFGGALALALSLVASAAFAQPTCPTVVGDPDDPDAMSVVGCYAEDVEWVWQDALFEAIRFDSGWVPGGSPLQLRLTFDLAGQTDITMGGTPTVSWPAPLEVRVPGRPGTGSLAIDYGMELKAYFRFDVEVAGVRYTFEDEIPIPFLPDDLRLLDETGFDPFLFPPEEPAVVMDATSRFQVVELDLAGGFIPIPGVGGGLAIDLQGDLETRYRTDRIVVADALPLEEEGAVTVVGPDDHDEPGFGPGKDLLVHPEGTLDQTGRILFFPTIFLEIAGRRFDFTLAEIPVPIVMSDQDVVFDDVLVHVPLPDIDLPRTEVDLGEAFVGMRREEVFRIENGGEAPLEVVVAPPAGFRTDRTFLEIPPMATQSITLSFEPDAAGPAAGNMLLSTNDPDESTLLVRLRGEGLAAPTPDAGPPDAGPMMEPMAPPMGGGCGCRVAPPEGASGGLFALALGALVLLRRRRASSPGSC
ncbi:MAG TPA: MYXO-CTERM sorting domain-containing protein [Polyangiaceae bacterium LLY-WYZ-15_(1-7)]|nr:hypothetical protein [Myxococcales bacterium]MAT27785.1 hypothetical protein [Sandaracinus sp.]HJL00105.1 MYXO-CTERM sorting domain-containing protein [Polyangiaceae bacterium LLY-WYZ-15_(1-7)]MBJ75110.1 hypothetical protein [Sandaracinus sp.]HJL09500.1 MYXO-CTERM sorting domain-containing protein [Polyangiaceae bacterium LLY-WYZ-15_(1-7)]